MPDSTAQPGPKASADGRPVRLETRETSQHRGRDERTPEQKREARRKRRGWEHAQVIRSLTVAGFDELAGDIERCGKLAVWKCGACGDMAGRRQLISCKSRLCPYCLQARAERIARKLVEHVCKFSNPVVIVLTVKNRPTLAEADEHLRSSWRKLSRRPAFREHFAGGFVFWETTHNPATGWHAHLHILADGYMPKQVLSDLWLACTGDSYIVDISFIKEEGRQDAVLEACKYPCKLSAIVEDPNLVREYLLHIRGRRLHWAFGSAYGLGAELDQLEDQDDERDADDLHADECPHCGVRGQMVPLHGPGSWWWLAGCERAKVGPWWVRVLPRPSGGGGEDSA